MALVFTSLGKRSFGLLTGRSNQVKQMAAMFSSVTAGLKPQDVPNVPLSSKYTYTRDGSIWTEEQRKFYEDNGFIIIRNLLSKEECERYIGIFKDIANGKISVPGMTVQKDISIKDLPRNENTVYKIQELFMYPPLFEYCRTPAILDNVEAICGKDIVAVHTMLINKPPDSGAKTSRHPLHQDLYYFPFRPENSIIAAWTALEKVNRENGCLVAIPGSHKGELFDHEYPQWEGSNALYHGVKEFKEYEQRVHIEMNQGDTVFFHPLLIHGSGTNRSKGYRKAISCHYASSTDCTYVDVKGTYQEKVAEEVKQLAFKRYGATIDDYAEIWKYRAQLVRGERARL